MKARVIRRMRSNLCLTLTCWANFDISGRKKKKKKNTINTQVSASWVNNNRLSSINMVQNLSIFWNTPMTTKLQSWLHTKTLLVSKTIYYWCSTSWLFFLNKILAIKLKPNKIRNPNTHTDTQRERESIQLDICILMSL